MLGVIPIWFIVWMVLAFGVLSWQMAIFLNYIKTESLKTKSSSLKTAVNTETPYWWKSAEEKEQNFILCHNNWRCPYSHATRCNKTERWTGWKIPSKTVKAWGSTLNLNEGCNVQRALLLKTINREHKRRTYNLQLPSFKRDFVEQVRVGSHREWVETTPKHGFHRIVEEYTTKFHDCLPGKSWLQEHYQDGYPETTIELSIEGKTLSVNGNYKPGMIKQFVKANRG